MNLPVDEFLRRFLLHTLPQGFVRIRHFGFLANRKRAVLLPLCFQSLGSMSEPAVAGPPGRRIAVWNCPQWRRDGRHRSIHRGRARTPAAEGGGPMKTSGSPSNLLRAAARLRPLCVAIVWSGKLRHCRLPHALPDCQRATDCTHLRTANTIRRPSSSARPSPLHDSNPI
jgi:hypothetical protein